MSDKAQAPAPSEPAAPAGDAGGLEEIWNEYGPGDAAVDQELADLLADDAGAAPAPSESAPAGDDGEAGLPPEVRRILAGERAKLTGELDELRGKVKDQEFTGGHANFLRMIQQDPRLRKHINSFFEEIGATDAQPESPRQGRPDSAGDAEEFEGLEAGEHEFARSIAKHVESRSEKRYGAKLAELDQRIAKFDAILNQIERQTEWGQFEKDYPQWGEFVDRADLEAAKQKNPGVPYAALFRQVGFDRVLAKTRQPQPPAPGRHDAAGQGRRRDLAAVPTGRKTEGREDVKTLEQAARLAWREFNGV